MCLKKFDLNLETVLQANVGSLAGRKAGKCGPLIKFIAVKACPEITAGIPGPILVVMAQVGNQEVTLGDQSLACVMKKRGG